MNGRMILIVFLLGALEAPPARTETSPATLQFLKQLSLRYYCLNREGLRNFKCDMKLTIPPEFEQRIKDSLQRDNNFKGDQCIEALNEVRYVLTVSDGKAEVIMQEPTPTGDDQVDKFVMKQGLGFGKMSEQVFQMWVGFTVVPIYGEGDFKRSDWQVQKEGDGFSIIEAGHDGSSMTSHFGSQGNLTYAAGSANQVPVSITAGFNPSPKGFVLGSLDLNIGEIAHHGTIQYGVVDRYWLPQKWVFDFMIPGALAEEDQFTLEFSNYQLNEAAANAGPVVRFTSKSIQPTYHFNFSTAQIEKINKKWVASRNTHEPGLTEFHYGWSFRYQFGAKNNAEGEATEIWANVINVDLSITRFDVYVSSRYPEGSCPHDVILKHENTHVAINERTFEKYKGILKQDLETDASLPTRAKPWKVKNLKAGKYMMEHYLSNVIGSVVKDFWAENGLENAKIDLPDSYRRTQALCSDW
jgi:hypothetical protein